STGSTKQTPDPRGTSSHRDTDSSNRSDISPPPWPPELGHRADEGGAPAALACVAVRPLAPCSPGDACAGIGAPVAWRHVAVGPANAHKEAPQAGGAGGARGTGLGEKSYVPDLLQGMGGDQRQTLHLSRAI